MNPNLITNTKQQALDLVSDINTRMDYPNDGIDSWAKPLQKNTDGKWYIKKHPTADMAGCSVSYTEENHDDTWIIPASEE